MVLFWYQWKEETHSYTLVGNKAIIENPERALQQHSPYGGRITENVSGG